MSTQQLTDELLMLPLPDRVALAEALWESIGEAASPPTEEQEREALLQARQRDQELGSGAVAGRSHEEVMAALRQALECG